jgi:hypothetical protein
VAGGSVQARQGAGEVGNAGKRELIKGDGGHVVLESWFRPQMWYERYVESL